jgi:hypothetical protein
MRRSRRITALLLSWVPLLIFGPLVSLASSLSGAGRSRFLGPSLLAAAVVSLVGSGWGIAGEPRPWTGWRIWPYFAAAPAAILLAAIWWLYFRAPA